ncbi:hypothetical protein PV11_08388 [Exophiala sideris]|uniref:Uncharacterized protein n=1 Tax=Exophiala sideris TaxID=1016849 RepID=A0A0D1Z223_9EURO|nr:hypothetical protein PV11_08388 [Exophiala sideris]
MYATRTRAEIEVGLYHPAINRSVRRTLYCHNNPGNHYLQAQLVSTSSPVWNSSSVPSICQDEQNSIQSAKGHGQGNSIVRTAVSIDHLKISIHSFRLRSFVMARTLHAFVRRTWKRLC